MWISQQKLRLLTATSTAADTSTKQDWISLIDGNKNNWSNKKTIDNADNEDDDAAAKNNVFPVTWAAKE